MVLTGNTEPETQPQMLRRTLAHLAPGAAAVEVANLSAYYSAVGQETPPPPGAADDEPELHGKEMGLSVSAAPYSGGFGSTVTLTPTEIENFKANGFLVKRGIIPQAKVEAALGRVCKQRAVPLLPPQLCRGASQCVTDCL